MTTFDKAEGSGRLNHFGQTAIPSSPVVFLGRRTLQKLYLVLHLGRMLQCARSVRLDTVNPSVDQQTIYDYCGLEIHEHPDSESLQTELEQLGQNDVQSEIQVPSVEISPQGNRLISMGTLSPIHMVDLPDRAVLPKNSQCFLVTDSDRNSLDQAMAALQASRSASPAQFVVHRIYLDIWEGAHIGVRYLEEMISRNFPEKAIAGERLSLAADERNWAAIIDNQHDDRLRLSGLTTEYRRLLADVAAIGFRLPLKESVRQIRMADRRKQTC